MSSSNKTIVLSPHIYHVELHDHILTDLKNPRWTGINVDSVRKCLQDLLYTKAGNNHLYGEVMYEPFQESTNIIDISKISHTISNIYFNESDNTIRGNIKFIDSPMGMLAQNAYVNYGFKFRIRVFGREESNQMIMLLIKHSIITWDEIITWDLVQKSNDSEDYLNSVTDFFQY